MKYTLVALFLFIAPFALAYNPEEVSIETPFEKMVIPMGEEGQKQSYYGVLTSYPHLYEFTIEEPTKLEVSARQKVEEEALPINLILLSAQPNSGQITEIVRVNSPIEEREERKIRNLGIEVYESESIEVELEPGLYRLEVSTAINESAYELDFGTESVDNSYFGMFATVWNMQQHFGYSWYRIFSSSFILYQIGILLIVGGIAITWHRRKVITHDS